MLNDRTYMYCAEDSPTSLVYEKASGRGRNALEDAFITTDFGWWVSSYCLPPPAGMAAAFAAAAAGASEPFSACYSSAWWLADELAAGPKVFDGLPEGELFSAKAAFCFCSESAHGSELWQRIGAYAGYFKWALLGTCVFVALVLLAGIYLVCGCKRNKVDTPWRLTPAVKPSVAPYRPGLVAASSRVVLISTPDMDSPEEDTGAGAVPIVGPSPQTSTRLSRRVNSEHLSHRAEDASPEFGRGQHRRSLAIDRRARADASGIALTPQLPEGPGSAPRSPLVQPRSLDEAQASQIGWLARACEAEEEEESQVEVSPNRLRRARAANETRAQAVRPDEEMMSI